MKSTVCGLLFVLFCMLPTAIYASFLAPVPYDVGAIPISIVSNDFDGDGYIDLAVACFDSNSVYILLGDGAGIFSAATSFYVGDGPHSIISKDIIGDNNYDLIVPCYNDHKLSLLEGVGDGTFLAPVFIDVGAFPVSVVTSDFNGDDLDDFAVAQSISDTVSILLGEIGGTFSTGTYLTTGKRPASIKADDFNNDGADDLVVACAGNHNKDEGSISIFIGIGDGTFGSAVPYCKDKRHFSVATNDFNGDGNSDLVTTIYGTDSEIDSVYVLLGNGDGTFNDHVPYEVGHGPNSVTSGDFDLDGEYDLAVTNTFSANVSILSGNGDGTFAAQDTFPAGLNPKGITCNDFDGNGSYDLAVTNYNSSKVSILMNQLSSTAGLACWDFNECAGDSAIDNCGNHNGYRAGASWASGVCGGCAFDYDGIDDCFAVPGGGWLTQPKGTMEAWIWIDPSGTGARIISTETAGWHDGFYISYGHQLSNNDSVYSAIMGGIHSTEGSDHYVETYVDSVSKGEWHFVAFVWDADTDYLLAFVDGDTSAIISPHAGIMDTGEPLTIGCYENGASRGSWFDGRVDEVRFYSAALPLDSLIAHYNAVPQYTLATNVVGNGSVIRTPAPSSYICGEEVIVTAIPDSGWMFDGWSDELSGTENPDTVTMISNTTITATFKPDTFTVTVTTDPIGLQVLVDSMTYIAPRQYPSAYGTSHEICVTTPQSDGDSIFYAFSHWSDEGDTCHTVVVPDSNPTYTANFLTYYEFARIDSIVDIPDDQGGWVRVHLKKSWYDSADEEQYPIATYNVWRRVDDVVMAQSIIAEGKILGTDKVSSLGPTFLKDPDLLSYLPLIQWQDRFFLSESSEPQLTSFPPGTWEIIGSFAAAQLENYIYAAASLGDFSDVEIPYTSYAISAHSTTPSVWFMSPADSGYSVDNISPGVPDSFSVAYNTGSGNHLSWAASVDDDFQYFRIYRGESEDFTPSPDNLKHATIETEWDDPQWDGWNVYYKVTAVDHVGNESDPATAGSVTAATEPVIPKNLTLYQNTPNPFNPTTVIRYDVPAVGAQVTLMIFDVNGRLIRKLVDGNVTSGSKSVTWDGTDSHGNSVSSGIYFCHLTANNQTFTKKMVLLK